MRILTDRILDIIYPKVCPLCERVTESHEDGFCEECSLKLKIIKEPVCICCGRPVEKDEVYCEDCAKYGHEFSGGRITFSYEQLSDSLYRFKYMNRPEYAKSYAKVIAETQKEWIKAISPDAFIPIPLHKKRLIMRGYNQAEELAEALSRYTYIPVEKSLVKRVKNTVPLKFGGRLERQNNLKGAFIVCENVVKLSTVVLVDDILTTGTTLDFVAAELKSYGVENIYFLTITAAGT